MKYSIDEKIKFYERRQKEIAAGRTIPELMTDRKYQWVWSRVTNLRKQKRQLKK